MEENWRRENTVNREKHPLQIYGSFPSSQTLVRTTATCPESGSAFPPPHSPVVEIAEGSRSPAFCPHHFLNTLVPRLYIYSGLSGDVPGPWLVGLFPFLLFCFELWRRVIALSSIMLSKQTPDDYHVIFFYCSLLPEGPGRLAFLEHLAIRRLGRNSGSGNWEKGLQIVTH